MKLRLPCKTKWLTLILAVVVMCSATLSVSSVQASPAAPRKGLRSSVVVSAAMCASLFLGGSGYIAFENHRRDQALQDFLQVKSDLNRTEMLGQTDYAGRIRLIEALEDTLFDSGASYNQLLFALKWLPVVAASTISELDVEASVLQTTYMRAIEVAVQMLNDPSIQANPLLLGTHLESVSSLVHGDLAKMMIFYQDIAKSGNLEHAPLFAYRQERLGRALSHLQWILLNFAGNSNSIGVEISMLSRLTSLYLLKSNVFDPQGLQMQEQEILYELQKSDNAVLHEAAQAVLQTREKARESLEKTQHRG